MSQSIPNVNPASRPSSPKGPTASPAPSGRTSNDAMPHSPTYAQMAARPPSPRSTSSARSEVTAPRGKAPATPPPTPLPTETPDAAPFTQSVAEPEDNGDHEWVTVKTSKKVKKNKAKKNKGKAKITDSAPAATTSREADSPELPSSPKEREPRKRRRVAADYGDDDRSTDKHQDAPPRSSFPSNSLPIFGQSPPSPSFFATTMNYGNGNAPGDSSDMDVDVTADLRAEQFGQPNLLLNHGDPPSQTSLRNNHFGHLTPDAAAPSSSYSRRSDRRSARKPSPAMSDDNPPFPLSQARVSSSIPPTTPVQTRGQRVRTVTPAAPSRVSTRASRGRRDERSPTPQPSRSIHVSSDEDVPPRSGVSFFSSDDDRSPTPPRRQRGRGRYSVAGP
ncbi:uncharacterized protein C8Q71DRAFT_861354 [Rhodofomes roseus]|uniref:Uncharacterized protein n=1 Tax=Rhodofomes roseus TaxID=34475 RepID=A0ABQ8K568_9APHY|nr:uncharacterized protein C8Q71DRAFT_861354 [Rhodofomes roseus]KAH9832066.1 hypothetical protein C8Q71DRAFT_861354 [Rhodofomes roseus]